MIQKLHCHCAQDVGLCVGYVKVYSCKIKSNLLCSKPEDGKQKDVSCRQYENGQDCMGHVTLSVVIC